MSQRAIGVIAVLASSPLYTLALVVQKYEAQKAGATGLGLLVALARRPLWLLGIGLQLAGFGLFTFALTSAPVSIVQPIFAAGIVYVPVFAALVLREYPGAREIVGMATTSIGVIAIVSTLGEGSELGRVSAGDLLIVVGALAVVLLALGSVSVRLGNRGFGSAGVIAGITAGIAFGSSDSMNKLMGGWLSPGEGWTPSATLGIAAAGLLVAFGVFGFVLFQNALKSFRAIVVASALGPANMLVPILVAIFVYGETLPSGTTDTAVRIGGLILVLVGALVLSTSERVATVYAETNPPDAGCR